MICFIFLAWCTFIWHKLGVLVCQKSLWSVITVSSLWPFAIIHEPHIPKMIICSSKNSVFSVSCCPELIWRECRKSLEKVVVSRLFLHEPKWATLENCNLNPRSCTYNYQEHYVQLLRRHSQKSLQILSDHICKLYHDAFLKFVVVKRFISDNKKVCMSFKIMKVYISRFVHLKNFYK